MSDTNENSTPETPQEIAAPEIEQVATPTPPPEGAMVAPVDAGVLDSSVILPANPDHVLSWIGGASEWRVTHTLSENTILENSPQGATLRQEIDALRTDLLDLQLFNKPLPFNTELSYSHGPSYQPLRMEIDAIKSEVYILKSDLIWIKDTLLELSKDAGIVKEAVEAKKVADALVAALQSNRRIIQPKI